jgi:hypothetical protein
LIRYRTIDRSLFRDAGFLHAFFLKNFLIPTLPSRSNWIIGFQLFAPVRVRSAKINAKIAALHHELGNAAKLDELLALTTA